ncbi:hypothetical protein FQN60_006537, partial [Etheostoma spectabile]
MEPGGASPDVLLQRPWLPVSIGGCRLLAKTWFGETAYHILLTDVQCVWEERMDSADLQTRSQAFFSHLREVVQPSLTGSDPRPDNEALMSLTRRDDGDIRMKLKTRLQTDVFEEQTYREDFMSK